MNEQQPVQPISLHQLALHRGMKSTTGYAHSYCISDYEAVGLYMLGGCLLCGASLAAYNAYPAKDGFWRCKNCIGTSGYATAEEANTDIFERKH